MIDFMKTATFTWGLNGVFFILICLAFMVGNNALRQGTRTNYVEYAPSLMTSLGLFGTFLGIFIGLVQFDSKQIDGSIQHLLNGLQTAFVTSILGMAFAIAFKVKQTNQLDAIKSTEPTAQPEEIEPKHIHSVLVKQHAALAVIAKSIGGDDERSLVGQLQMLRTDVVDLRSATARRQENFETKLWTQLDSFAEMMSRSATEQVISALKQVIVEFNQKLTEQFGDNFKRLDESVKKLVDWQATYMIQLEEMTRLYRLGTESIDVTKVAIQSIRVETSRIPEDMRLLSDVITVNQHQISELTTHLNAFVMMRDQAVIAVPHIQKKLSEIGEQLLAGANNVNLVLIEGSKQFEDSVKHTNSSLINSANVISSQSEKISEDMTNALDMLSLNTERIRSGITSTISESMTSLATSSKDMVAKSSDASIAIFANLQTVVQSAIDSSAKTRLEMQKVIESTNTAMVQHADRSLQGVEKQVQEAVNRTNEAVNAQLRQLDEALGKQLNAALQELGSSLGTIARHLGDAYQRNSDRNRIGS